jgi:RNA polymerase sigma-70 factor (ECF subfamily)
MVLFSLSDEQAMCRVQQQNDPRAFALLVRRWEPWTRRFCARMTGDAHIGEDLTQEVFMQILTHRHSFQHRARFGTYLRRIAYNACCDWSRHVRRHPESTFGAATEDSAIPEALLKTETPSPDAVTEQQEQAKAVRSALFKLPEYYRQVVILRHYEDLRFREIAELMGIPDGTVRSRMAKALTQLAKMLTPVLGQGSKVKLSQKEKIPDGKDMS